jgi:hypothetical protein
MNPLQSRTSPAIARVSVTLLLVLSGLALAATHAGASTGTTSPADRACQADGATVATALAAFRAENPSVTPSATLLVSHQDGGPYITSWPYNDPYYSYSINGSGRLLVSVPSSAKKVPYAGPSACKKLKNVAVKTILTIRSCEADGATLSTALAAFRAENRSVTPTKADLLGPADGGPYLQSWAHNPPHYAFHINSVGNLMISIPDTASGKLYAGLDSCAALLALK